MNKQISVRGHSDDIVYIDGDIEEECYPKNDSIMFFLSDGTAFTMTYTMEGQWMAKIIRRNPFTTIDIKHADDNDDQDCYTDVINIEGNFKWIAEVAKIMK